MRLRPESPIHSNLPPSASASFWPEFVSGGRRYVHEHVMAIYFIVLESPEPLVKIGYTDRDPIDRLRELQTANPYPLRLVLVCDGDIRKESELHRSFSHLRTNGEWFRYTAELQTFVSVMRFVHPRIAELEESVYRLTCENNRLSGWVNDLSNLAYSLERNLA